MKLIQMEIRKVLQSISIWFLIIAAIVVNIGIIFANHSYRNDVTYINEISGQMGTKITAQSVDQMQRIYDSVYQKLSIQYEMAMGFPPDQLEDIAKMASAEDTIRQLDILDRLIYSAKEVMDGTAIFQKNRITCAEDIPILRNTTVWQTERLYRRAAEINEKEEAQYLSLKLTPMREVLYAKLLFAIYMEMIIISAFIVFGSLENEFIHDTQAVVYTCKKGRALQKSKMYACIVTITCYFLLVAGVSLIIYYFTFPQWSLMDTPASAGLYPDMITKYSLSCKEYLFLNLGTGYLLTISFALLAGALGLLITNVYIGMMTFGGCLALMLLAGGEYGNLGSALKGLVPLSNPLTLLMQINFSDKSFSVNCSSWFLYKEGFPLFPFFELAVIVFWFAAIILFYQCLWKAFKRKDL